VRVPQVVQTRGVGEFATTTATTLGKFEASDTAPCQVDKYG